MEVDSSCIGKKRLYEENDILEYDLQRKEKVKKFCIELKDMEPKSIFSSFVLSARQYFASPIEPNHLNLQKHLDIVTALSAASANSTVFDCHQLVVVESFKCLVGILTNKCDETSLIQRVFAILSNLAKETELFKTLESTFRLHSGLSLFLQQYGSPVDVTDPLVSQCLSLLEVSTDGVEITYVGEHLKNLINILIIEINNNKSSEMSTLALHILANLCRNNLAVQSHITSLDNLKKFYKTIVPKLRGPSQKTVIYALSILMSLQRTSYLHERVFTSKELSDAFELIVTLFVKDESLSDAALNLFFDMMANQQALQLFLKHPKIETAVSKIVNAFTDATSLEQSTRFLKFIWTFVKHAESRYQVIKVLFTKSLGEKKLHLLLRKWSTESFDSTGEATYHALKIIHAMVEVSNIEELFFFQPCFQKMVKKQIQMVQSKEAAAQFSPQHLDTLSAVFELLFLFLERQILQDVIIENIDISACQDLIKAQFENNALSFEKEEWSGSGVDLLLSVASVLVRIKDSSPDANEFLKSLLQEPKLISFLAYGFSSTLPQRVQRSIYILVENPALQLTLLAQSVSASVQNHLKAVKSQLPICENEVVNSRCSQRNLDKSIDCLVRRIESGLELPELKESEILQVYRHRISALNVNMKELQDLVEAKSAALHQADKAVEHYMRLERMRNYEELKIQQQLEESKQFSENTSVELKKVRDDLSKTEKELKLTLKDVASLQEIKKQQEDNIKQLEDRVSTVENERDELSQVLREKESEIKDLETKCANVTQALEDKSKDYDDLTQKQKSLLKQHEKDREKFKQELNLLEVVCSQRDTKIKELEAQNKSLSEQNNSLTEELEQHKYITQMIHEMSSKTRKREMKDSR